MLTIPWSVSVTFVHYAQTVEVIDKISFAYDSPMCLSQIALKFGLHRQLLPPQILLQSDPPPVELSVGNIQQQIVAESLVSTAESL